jgi:20S proteasome alpha/beta subunit
VTIAAGFVCFDGIVMCADTQETISGYTKRSATKIRLQKENGYALLITGAGDSHLIDIAAQSIEKAFELEFSPKLAYPPERAKSIIDRKFREFYDNHIAPHASLPREERPFVDLLIGIVAPSHHYLFKASGVSVCEIEADGDCIGSGAIIARNLISELYSPFMNIDEVAIAGCYILHQAKKYVDGCGGDTNIVIASFKHDYCAGLGSKQIKAMEESFDQFDQAINIGRLALPNSNISHKDFQQRLEFVTQKMLKVRHDLITSHPK